MKTNWQYAVTFESNRQAPVTVRGVVESTKRGAARLAMREAMAQAKGKRWSSAVVMIERVDSDE